MCLIVLNYFFRVVLTSFGTLFLAGTACTKNHQMIFLLTVIWYLQTELCLLLVKMIENKKNC